MSTNKSKCKNEGKKRNDDMALMWLNWSIATINATLQLLDVYRLDRNEIMLCQTILSVSIWTISLVLAWGLMTPPL